MTNSETGKNPVHTKSPLHAWLLGSLLVLLTASAMSQEGTTDSGAFQNAAPQTETTTPGSTTGSSEMFDSMDSVTQTNEDDDTFFSPEDPTNTDSFGTSGTVIGNDTDGQFDDQFNDDQFNSSGDRAINQPSTNLPSVNQPSFNQPSTDQFPPDTTSGSTYPQNSFGTSGTINPGNTTPLASPTPFGGSTPNPEIDNQGP